MADTDPAAGAKPGDDAKSGQADPAGDPKGAKPDDLGDAGKKALREERQRARDAETRAAAAEAELETLKAATQSETDKAIEQARKEGAAESDRRWMERVRTVEVRSALRAAGIASDRFLDLAANASEFSELKVSEDGTVAGITEAIATFKTEMPEAFTKPATSATAGTVKSGVQAEPGPEVQPGYERMAAAYASGAGKKQT